MQANQDVCKSFKCEYGVDLPCCNSSRSGSICRIVFDAMTEDWDSFGDLLDSLGINELGGVSKQCPFYLEYLVHESK